MNIPAPPHLSAPAGKQLEKDVRNRATLEGALAIVLRAHDEPGGAFCAPLVARLVQELDELDRQESVIDKARRRLRRA